MRKRQSVVWGTILGLTIFTAACENEGGDGCPTGTECPEDASVDAAADASTKPDGASPDASEDAQTSSDASEPDATPLDASEPDASEPDASEPDASEPDASEPDATAPDADVDVPPKPGFTLSGAVGVAPVLVTATSTAVKGSADIVQVLYDWGDGNGFVASTSHKYFEGGAKTVRQRVVDSAGLSAESEPSQLTISSFTPVRFSNTDKSPQIYLSVDRYAAGIRSDVADAHTVRSTESVNPGAGVFYFEAESLVPAGDDDFSSVGVGTASHPGDQFVGLNDVPSGTITPSFGVNIAAGHIQPTGGACTGRIVSPGDPRVLFDRSRRRFAFVVDYRAASNPVIYALVPKDDDTLELRRSCQLLTNQGVYITFAGRRSTLGPQLRINTGSDVTNHPFHWTAAQVATGLQTIEAGGTVAPGDVAPAIQRGWVRSRAPIVDQAPVLTVSADLTVNVGTQVQLTASANDAEEGNLNTRIEWTDLSEQLHLRQTVSGTSYTFTPTRIGRYAIEARVTDSVETTTTKLVTVTVSGTLPVSSVNDVRLVPTPGIEAGSSAYIQVSPNGLNVTRQGSTKNGARANQANYGNFWYFEARRNGVPANLGVGLIIPDGQINPYRYDDTPWSMSLNMETGIWRNLNAVASYDSPSVNDVYGFAVDYRGVHPKVYVVVGNATSPGNAQLAYQTELTEIWGPIHPMLYGTVGGSGGAEFSTASINFGRSPFVFSQAILDALLGANAAGLQRRWGNP